jgi:phospholipase/carboxylesterase
MDHPIEWLPAEGEPAQLILLLRGGRSDATALLPWAQARRSQFPQAAMVAPDAPTRWAGHPTQRLWYGIGGLTPDNWPDRVARCVAWMADLGALPRSTSPRASAMSCTRCRSSAPCGGCRTTLPGARPAGARPTSVRAEPVEALDHHHPCSS